MARQTKLLEIRDKLGNLIKIAEDSESLQILPAFYEGDRVLAVLLAACHEDHLAHNNTPNPDLSNSETLVTPADFRKWEAEASVLA